jgi:hypothetical protein
VRDTYKYSFFSEDGDELHCGITNDLDRREGEHRRRFGEPDGYIEQDGRRTTRAAAEAWERRQRCSPYDREANDGLSAGEVVGAVVKGAAIGLGIVVVGAALVEAFGSRR